MRVGEKLDYLHIYVYLVYISAFSPLSSSYDKLGIKDQLIEVLFFGHQTNYILRV